MRYSLLLRTRFPPAWTLYRNSLSHSPYSFAWTSSSDLFQKIDTDDTSTVDFEEFFKFYKVRRFISRFASARSGVHAAISDPSYR